MKIINILESLDLGDISEDKNDYLVICPFHEDTNPSLRIHKEKGLVNCFAGCVKGNVFDLIAKRLSITREEAKNKYTTNNLFTYEMWQNNLKLNLNSIFNTKTLLENYSLINSIDYISALSNEDSLRYLFSRGLTRDTIKIYKILYNIKCREIAIPIFNKEGKLESFVNRSILEKRYKNSFGFSISKLIFGLNLIAPSSECYLVEGAFDQIKLYQYGFKNVLALFHSGISDTQVSILKKYFKEINLMLDNDDAGNKATGSIAAKLIREGFIVYRVELDKNKDPDEHTKEDLEERIRSKKLNLIRGE